MKLILGFIVMLIMMPNLWAQTILQPHEEIVHLCSKKTTPSSKDYDRCVRREHDNILYAQTHMYFLFDEYHHFTKQEVAELHQLRQEQFNRLESNSLELRSYMGVVLFSSLLMNSFLGDYWGDISRPQYKQLKRIFHNLKQTTQHIHQTYHREGDKNYFAIAREEEQQIHHNFKIIDFILTDRASYVDAYNKFIPDFIINQDEFESSSLTSYECRFLTVFFQLEVEGTSEIFNIKCNKPFLR